MNSYNENLYATGFACLAGLEMDKQKSKSQLDASMFTLYYAQGAGITAFEKLEEASNSHFFEQEIKTQAINCNNVSVNLLQVANQQKGYTAQSVTNAAICAANVQVASNDVVRLASDIGAIYSMLNATEADTDLFSQADAAYNLMNDTAYGAEVLSQKAMEASVATAEVSSADIADQATSTNASVGNLFKEIAADFDAISAYLTSSNAGLASARAAEKIAEGALEMNIAGYNAIMSAIALSNKELNLNLTASALNSNNIDDVYEIRFAYYKAPFLTKTNTPNDVKTAREAGYPVKDYYVMLVKDSKKATFSITHAEALIDTGRCFKVKSVPELPGQTDASVKIKRLEIKDSDGDEMQFGTKYVVYVLAVFLDDYKRTINTFDDYLTAPSANFELTNHLASPEASTIRLGAENKLMFTLANNRFPSEYRCIFLSGPASPTGGFLSESGLRSIEREVQKQESVEAASSPSEATANVKSCLFFNKQIAEQVSRANYLIAEVKHNTGNVFIDSTATDNFGNPLVEGKSYTPVILSVANAAGSELEKYTGSISDYENTGWYVHQPDSKKQ